MNNNNLDDVDDNYPIFFPKYLFINNQQNINRQNNQQNINRQNNLSNINLRNNQQNINLRNNQLWKFKLK